jgi:LCP family protein required for cell wall assembly
VTDWPPEPVNAPRRHGAGVATLARRGGKALLTMVSVAVLCVTGYGWRFITSTTQGLTTTDVFADNSVHVKPLDGAVDILLVGQDSRTDAQGNPLSREVLDMLHAGVSDGERQTDTMILVHIPQNGKQAIAFSFPRDSWVDITGGFGKHKLNSAYVYAYNDKSKTLQQKGNSDLKDVDRQAKEAGRKNLITTLEQFIGKPGMIDRYAEVNLASFYEITKSIGGVEVCLNNAVKEKKSGVDLPAGRQTVEGVQALAFVRQRYDLPNGDLDRIQRQQAFLSGLANKVLSGEVLTSPTKMSGLVDAVKKSVVLSSGWNLLEFAEQMRGLTGGNIQFHTIPTQGNATIGGADVIKVDIPQVRAAIDALVTDGVAVSGDSSGATPSSGQVLPGADAVTVDFFDGTGNTTTGPQARTALQDKGFKIGGDTKLATRSSTVFRYAPGDEAALALVKQALGDTIAAELDKDVAVGHVRVLLGKDFKGAPTGAGSESPSKSNPPAATTTPVVPPSGAVPGDNAITAGGVPCVN